MSYLFDSVPTDGGYYPNISLWNTARVTDMTSMFRNTRVFNGNISQWNVEAVTNMDYMFEYAGAFDGDLSKWNTLALTNKQDMFLHATAWNDAYTNVGTGTDGPPNMWETKAI
jgi:surface protein